MSNASPRLLVIGAHPDDAEFHAGGLACEYRRAGFVVKFVSVTNGAAGHHVTTGPALAARRRGEAAAAAARIGAEGVTWDFPDGGLTPSLDVRWNIVREIRMFRPDLVLAHRTNDYHPDHRAAGQAVQDASYMVTVPAVAPEAPALRHDPVVAFMPDRFTRPAPLRADVTIDVGEHIDAIVGMLACHESQVFEWLPWHDGVLEQVPADSVGRRAWLAEWYLRRLAPQADRYRRELIATYGAERGAAIRFAEVYEISEYAAPLTDAERSRLFPFLPATDGAGCIPH